MFKLNLDEVKDFINAQSQETKIYIGCDSERLLIDGIWYADYTVAIVIHIDGKHGCKLFGEVNRERDFDQKFNRPRFRLMTEAYKLSALYLSLADVLVNRYVEVHLDINPSEVHGSNCVLNEAIGYIRGTCNVIPMIKPNAFAASYAADRFKGLKSA
jgi:predicted RNase H-related nuclease YkuK (DUF458 family)